jgi:hypothetical protein
MKLTVMSMNEDGSADCEFDMTNEELTFFAKIGILKVLEDSLKDMKVEDESKDRTV